MMMLQHLPPSHTFVGSSASSTASPGTVSPSPQAPSETPTPPPVPASTVTTPLSPATDADPAQSDRIVLRHHRHHRHQSSESPRSPRTNSESGEPQEEPPRSPSPRNSPRPPVDYSQVPARTRSRSRSRSRSVSVERSRTPPQERKEVQQQVVERVNVIRYLKEERACPIIRRRSSVTDTAMEVDVVRPVHYKEEEKVADRQEYIEAETGNDADVEEDDEKHPRDYYAPARRTSPYRDFVSERPGEDSPTHRHYHPHNLHHHRHSPARQHHKSGSGSSYARSSRDSSSPRRMVTDHEDSDYSESSHQAPGELAAPRVTEVIRETVVAGEDRADRLRLVDGRYKVGPYNEEEDVEGDAEEEEEEDEEEEEEEEDLDAPLDLSMKIKRRPRSSSVTEDSDDSAGPDYAEHHNRGPESAAYKKSLMKRYREARHSVWMASPPSFHFFSATPGTEFDGN
ncbi:ecdysone-induced protein 74EF [Anopheles sinensis]|uniref:Ecdysone-induced protein 74EF n=1 Tax=Anopheles sinensis TaxID=74873 RepID=A0A084WS50_ANOSI|nr:ecdysone-induced protein 74EF [Anopheles sinensis]